MGGVATGSMKAQLADSAEGIASTSGVRLRPGASAASTGTSVAVVAVLLVLPVAKTISVTRLDDHQEHRHAGAVQRTRAPWATPTPLAW